MGILDKNNLTSLPDSSFEYRKAQQETLSSLRDDDEFVKRTERFLESVGEGDSIADMYQYFRGADWSLRDIRKVSKQSKDFNKQQLEDYNYLRTRFDNANVGGFREKAQLGVDVTQELLSDPINWASAVLIPWSGGTSLAARAAGGEATKQALKEATKLGIRQSLGKVVLNTPGQVLKGPLTTKQILSVASAEGMLYGGTHNYVKQSIDINTGRRDERSLKETAIAAGIGGVAAPAVLAGLKGIGKIPKWVNTVNEQRIARIDNNENYKANFFERAIGSTVEGLKTTSEVLKLTALPLRPTTFLRKKAKENELFQKLLKLIRYDAMEGFKAPEIGKQEVLQKDYNMQLKQLWGNLDGKVTKILGEDGFNLYSFQNRFTSQYKKNWGFNPGLSDEVNFDLAYVIRSGKNTKIVDGKEVKIETNIVKAGYAFRRLLNNIYDKAVKAGLNPNRAENYFPRGWRIDVIKNNKEEFIEKIIKAEGASKEEATALWTRLATEGTPESSTTSGLSSRLQSERLLNKLDDAEFGKFLNNDVEGVMRQYVAESSSLITRTKLFGETTEDFVEKWINPIKKSGLNLEKKEELYLKSLYEVVTGQRGRINRNAVDPVFGLIPYGKWGAAIHDTLTVTMQTSMLGLSTMTSFAEIGVPLLLGNEARVGLDAIKKGILNTGEEWWKRNKQMFGVGDPNVDIRSANRQDLNAFMSSVNLAGEDRAVAIYGQAVGKTATKIQNFFFKSIGLHDWTRFVQLVGYDMGKNLIHKNLRTIADNATASRKDKRKAIDIKRMEDELAELGINVQNGLNWLDRGALHTDRFFMQDIRAAANRYTDEVVMNPTAASAQKPLVHSLATTKWIYGLMGFPTAFANGPLRRVIRNLTKDAETIVAGGRRISAPRAATGALFMVNIGLLNYTLRTGGKNWEDLKSGKITEEEMLERSLMYAGLLGPGEIYVRYTKAKKYESKIMSVMGSVTGPNLTDLIDYITDFTKNGTLAETALKRAPFSMSIKSLYPETYKKWQKAARELDKNMGLGPEGSEKKEVQVLPLFKGGEVSEENPVPNAAPEPSERINPYTGEPYESEMERLGFAEGGNPAREKRIAEREERDRIRKQKEEEIIKGIDENLNPLQKAAMVPVPVVSDIAGVAGDIQMYLENPETKSWGNYALTGLGALPFVPSVAGSLKHVKALPKTYHGAKKAIPSKLESFENYTSEGSIYGDGFYTTSRKDTAKGYAGKKGIIYETLPKKRNTKLFDMDDKIPSSIKNHLKKSYDSSGDQISEYTGAILDFIDDNPKASLLDLYDEMRKVSPYHNMPKYEVLDQLYALNGILRNKGYKGLRHRGGVLTSSPEHEVNIFFDPQKDLNVKPIAEWYTDEQLKAMKRKPKKDGGLLVSIGVAPVSDKEINKLKKSLKKRQAKKNGGKATRNYAKEYANYHSSDKQKKDRAHRNNANRQLKREGRIAKGDGRDVDHKDGNPRNNSPSNLTVKSKNTNRSFSRRLKARNGGDVEAQESLSNQILKTIQQNRNWSDDETAILNSFANLVGYAESDNQADRLQDSGGPGRGMYQYEIGESQGASTGRNRFFNFAKNNNINVPEEYLGLLGEQGPTSIDFSSLPQDLQTAIFYADKAEHPEFKLNDLVSGKLSPENAWADYHWAGDPTEKEAKVDYFLRKNNLIK